jgi:uncharacterized membrane protein (UPF0127 family)
VKPSIWLLGGAGICCALVASCGAAPGAGSEATPTPAVSGPRVVMPSGAVYSVEIARTPEEKAQGLMYREGLAPRTGMIFPFEEAAPHHFWMKNTMIPLDMIWLDSSGKVVYVSANTPPCRSDPCPNYGPDVPSDIVLEIAGGLAEKEGVKPGAVIRLLEIPPP